MLITAGDFYTNSKIQICVFYLYIITYITTSIKSEIELNEFGTFEKEKEAQILKI